MHRDLCVGSDIHTGINVSKARRVEHMYQIPYEELAVMLRGGKQLSIRVFSGLGVNEGTLKSFAAHKIESRHTANAPSPTMTLRLVVLISGNGSNIQAIVDAIAAAATKSHQKPPYHWCYLTERTPVVYSSKYWCELSFYRGFGGREGGGGKNWCIHI